MFVVHNPITIAKLADYGFHLSACKLIASYLLLGPLLFDIFINGIFLLNMPYIYNYTDDNCMSYSHNNADCIKSALTLKQLGPDSI